MIWFCPEPLVGQLPFMSPEDLGKKRWGESPGGWLRPESGGAANGRWL